VFVTNFFAGALKDEKDEAVNGALETALDTVRKKVMSKKMRIF
jgi:hypothetical protein